MPNNIYEIPVGQLTNKITMTVKIKGIKRWQVKLWLAKQLFKATSFIVAWLIGCHLEIEEDK